MNAYAQAPEVEPAPTGSWHSGWCGPGPGCLDGKRANKAGEVLRSCHGFYVNGEKASRPGGLCACPCHDEDNPVEPTAMPVALREYLARHADGHHDSKDPEP